jgi:hypothetical protein
MTSPTGLPPVTFRESRGQGCYRVVFGLVLIAVGISLLVVHPKLGGHPAGVILTAAPCILIGLLGVAARGAYTTIDSRGLRSSSLLARHALAWSEIEDIDCKLSNDGDGDWSEHVRVKPRGQRAFLLPQPRNSSGKAAKNPKFDEQLSTIREYWRNATVPASGDPHG